MFFEIRHETRYRYSDAVHLGRHTLRLRPMSDARQHLHRFKMSIEPSPAGTSDLSDLDGNYATAAWFETPTNEVVILTESVVETFRTNPFDYLWQGPTGLPLTYSGAFKEALGPFRATIVPETVASLAQDVANQSGNNAQVFAGQLASHLHQLIPRIVRPEGDPHEAPETLKRGEGSCRDLAVLFIAAARAQGFAARFISGYNATPGEHGSFDLHAWPEVYLPGGGWRGFDPTTGLAVGDRHIAIAAGALAEQAAPVSGTYAGGATAKLDTYVSISEIAALS